jgi:hypothetical protein
MNEQDYLQECINTLSMEVNWYGWKKVDSDWK